MAEPVSSSPAPRKRRGFLRVLGWLVGIVIVLVIIAYFVGTSSAFFKGVILPKVSTAMNAQVTVADASISPFRQVVLTQLKVQTTGSEPLITAPEVRLRYHLLDIIRGNIKVDEVSINSPSIVLVQNPDGTSNLDPILKAQQQPGKPAQPAKPSEKKPSKPMQIDIQKVAITDGTVRAIKLYQGGQQDVTELSHVNFGLDNLKNGQTGKMALSAELAVNNHPVPPQGAGILQAKIDGGFDIALTPELNPGSVKGKLGLNVTRAEGAMAQASGLAGALDCDVSPTEIKQVALHFQKGQTPLGQLLVSGPLDMEKKEGHIKIELKNVDKNLLNLAGAASGLDFGPTTIDSTNDVVLAKSGQQITTTGGFNVNKFQVTRNGETTPSLDLHAGYGVAVDQAASNVVLNAFTLEGKEKGSTFLHGELTSPMAISMGQQGAAVGDSTLNFELTHFALADWRPFVGDSSLTGDINANLKVTSQQGGKQNALEFDSDIKNLTAATGSVQVANLNLKGNLKVSQPAPNQQTVTGNLALSDFNGQFGSNRFSNFGITSDLDINSTPQEVQLRKISGRILQGQNAGGNFELTGSYGLSNKVAQINAKLDGLNENGLSPFLQPALGDKNLNSVLVTATANVQYDPEASSTIKAGLQVTNLVVNDPSHQVPATPLSAGFQLDTSMNHQVVDLRQCQMNLTPTQRGSNQLQLTGRVDMSQTNAIQGALKLAADSLDLTTYYDLFSGPQNATLNKAAPGGAAPATSTTSAAPEKEPDAKQLPFRNFTFDANIRRLYLHEVEIDDWQTSVKLDGGHVVVSPCKLTLNGAPVNASVDTDMGVPGFKYDVAFDAQAIPLAPLVNSFKPQQKGILSGTLTGQAKIDGAGITGPSLQKNLSGNYDLSSTNLNLAVENVQNKFLKPVLQAITTIPDMLQNPGNLGSSLLSGVMGGSKSSAANTNSITRSPIEAIIAKGTIGSGKVNLQQTVIQSPSFEAQANGTVELAPIITNSTLNIPIQVSLARPLAQALLLAPTNTPTSQTYVQLPSFLTQTGTIGKPQTKTDKKVLLTAAAQIAAARYGDKGALGGLLQQGQSLLGGSSGTNAANTNRAGGLGGLLRGLEGGGNASSSSGNTNKAPGTNQSPGNNLLNRFLGPGK